MGEGGLKPQYKRLIDYFKPHPMPSEEFYKAWMRELEFYEPRLVAKAVDWVERNETRMPSIKGIVAIVDTLGEKERDEQAAKERRQNQEHRFIQPRDDYGQKCLAIIDDLFDGKLTRGEYLERCREIGIDTYENERWYEKQRLDLNKKPRK